MRFAVVTILAALCGLVSCLQSAQARVRIHVDLSSQTMHVSSASGDYVWPISSARSGFSTPRGTYGVQRLEAMHRSHKYHNSPMPHSIFFKGGYAIHGTYAVGVSVQTKGDSNTDWTDSPAGISLVTNEFIRCPVAEKSAAFVAA